MAETPEHVIHVEEDDDGWFYWWCSANSHGYSFRQPFATREEAEAAAAAHEREANGPHASIAGGD